MRLSELITPDAVRPLMRATSKTAALSELSEVASAVSGLSAEGVLEAVLQREQLGSTGIGSGIAVPHGKVEGCGRIFGVFARLEKPIAFDAIDGAPVDLLFMLIASETAGADHLKALARIARFFRPAQVAAQIRATRDPASIFAILSRTDVETHAA